jgi:drug/metabolite transporter (DMT)-like permease
VTWRVWLAFAALCVIWGLPYFFIKLAVVEISPAAVAWSRLALGAAVLLPIAWRRGALTGIGQHARAILGFAVIELVIPFVLIAWGERWVSSSLTGILIATVPLTVILLSPLFGAHEPLGGRRLLGLAGGFGGVLVLLGFDAPGNLSWWLGALSVMGGTLGYAIGALIVQQHMRGLDQLGGVAASLAVAALVLLPAAWWSAPAHAPSMTVIDSLLVLGIVCTALAMLLYFFLITHAGAARAAVITYVNPAIATLLGVGVLHEPAGPGLGAGLALILTGSWLATQRAR